MNHLYDGISTAGGEPVLSIELLGALCGIGPEEALAEFERQAEARGTRDRFTIPPAWKRGAKELQARLGTTDSTEIIEHLRAEAAAKQAALN